MILEQDVKDLAARFWAIVTSGANGKEANSYFINPGILLPTGEWIDLESHQVLHRSLCDECHKWLDLNIKQLSGEKQRALAKGRLHWEASFKERKTERIKAIVEETWMLEYSVNKGLRWTLYWSETLELLPGSAIFKP